MFNVKILSMIWQCEEWKFVYDNIYVVAYLETSVRGRAPIIIIFIRAILEGQMLANGIEG